MNKIVFASMASQQAMERVTLLFESLRAFGGEFAQSPCILFIPGTMNASRTEIDNRLRQLNVNVIALPLDREIGQFPLAPLVFAAAEAEERIEHEAEILVWMNEDTLVLRPPSVFLLPGQVNYAYRPVHHTRIGSVYSKPPDEFWSLIYRHCGVTQDRVFPVETCTRDNVLRAYFNAGIQVIRPKKHLLVTWRDTFSRLYQKPDFKPFYAKDALYKVFMHQAVLAGVVLSMFKREEMVELPETVNYPLHLHGEYPLGHRPQSLNELVTCRYEGIEDLGRVLETIPVKEPMKSWLNEKLR